MYLAHHIKERRVAMESQQLKNILEAALLASGGPLTVEQLQALFGDRDGPEKTEIRDALKQLQEDYEGRGVQLKQVASGYRVQIRENMAQWLTKLWEERPPRYSRALMETLAIIAYRQPVTRGDVEDIRGVSVTTNIIRTLLERNWIKVVGHRDVPGKPAMFGTTREFLDYFDLKKLDDLPPLAELAELEPVGVQLELEESAENSDGQGDAEPAGEISAESASAEESDQENDSGEGEPLIAEHDEFADEVDDDAEDDEDAIDFSALDELNKSVVSDVENFSVADKAVADSAEMESEIDVETETEAEVIDDVDADPDQQSADVAPGAVAPLVGLNSPDEDESESAIVTSLDAVRARG
jgi:segregation and condensation protein B